VRNEGGWVQLKKLITSLASVALLFMLTAPLLIIPINAKQNIVLQKEGIMYDPATLKAVGPISATVELIDNQYQVTLTYTLYSRVTAKFVLPMSEYQLFDLGNGTKIPISEKTVSALSIIATPRGLIRTSTQILVTYNFTAGEENYMSGVFMDYDIAFIIPGELFNLSDFNLKYYTSENFLNLNKIGSNAIANTGSLYTESTLSDSGYNILTQPGDKGWLGYADNGELNGGVFSTYDNSLHLGWIPEYGNSKVWCPFWVDPNYNPTYYTEYAEYYKMYLIDNWGNEYTRLEWQHPIPRPGYQTVTYTFSVGVGYGGLSCTVSVSYTYSTPTVEGVDTYYLRWEYVPLSGEQIQTHSSSTNAWGTGETIVYAPPGSSGDHPCQMKVILYWKYLHWQGRIPRWFHCSTNWLIINFSFHVWYPY